TRGSRTVTAGSEFHRPRSTCCLAGSMAHRARSDQPPASAARYETGAGDGVAGAGLCRVLTEATSIGRSGSPAPGRLLGEGVELGLDADQGERASDDAQVQLPDVLQDAAQPRGGVVPALLRGARVVVAAQAGDEGGRPAGQGCAEATDAGIGVHEVEPGL